MTLNVPRILKLFLLPNLAFAALALTLAPTTLIAGINAVLVALATGVVVSFAADAARIVTGHKEMTKVHWLVLGITTHWLGTDGSRLWSIAWRWLGQPMEMANSHFVAYFLYLSACGAYFHLAASEALGEEKIPRARWVRYGVLVAASIFVAMAIGFAVDRWSEAGTFVGAFG